MAQTIRIKSSTVAGRTPTDAQLERAELCINLADRKLFSKDQNDEVFEVTPANTYLANSSGIFPDGEATDQSLYICFGKV